MKYSLLNFLGEGLNCKVTESRFSSVKILRGGITMARVRKQRNYDSANLADRNPRKTGIVPGAALTMDVSKNDKRVSIPRWFPLFRGESDRETMETSRTKSGFITLFRACLSADSAYGW